MKVMKDLKNNLVISILLLCEFGLTHSSKYTGTPTKSVSSLATQDNPFAPNSAIFKIPVSKTVNLDFRNANDRRIRSELLEALTDLLKNKDVKQDKVILNVKPPKGTNSTFVKNFTTLLRTETVKIDSNVIIGAKSTLFKKKNGEISNLRLTLYIVRQQKPNPTYNNKIKIVPKRVNIKKISRPTIEEANINITQAQNLTATVLSVLQQLIENSTENEINQTDIFLHLTSSTNFSLSQITSLERSMIQFLQQLYPNSTISITNKLFHKRSTHVSKLEFDINVQPKLMHPPKPIYKITKPLVEMLSMTVVKTYNNATSPTQSKISINGTNTIENTILVINHKLEKLFNKFTEKGINKIYILFNLLFSRKIQMEQKKDFRNSLQDLMHQDFPESSIIIKSKSIDNKNSSKLYVAITIAPKQRSSHIPKLSGPKLNVTLISSSPLIQETIKSLKNDLHDIVPYSKVLVEAQNLISKDLNKLKDALERGKDVQTRRFPIDLGKPGSSFDDEFGKALPRILSTVKETVEPITLAFEIRMSKNAPKSTMNTDICSIVKILTDRIPARTHFGNVNLDITVLPEFPYEKENKEPSKFSVLNLASPGINITNAINETLAKLMPQMSNGTIPYREKEFNISMIIPNNETAHLVEEILNLIRNEMKILFPYSQILIQSQKTIADDLRILKLNVGINRSHDESSQHKENIEVLPIDLSSLGKIPQELKNVLSPIWSKKNSRPMSFDLKLRPANDIQRGLLGNDICSIVDNLSRNLPKDRILNAIDLRITVLPDQSKIPKESSSEKDTDESESSQLLEKLDLGNPERNLTEEIQSVLKEFVEGQSNTSTASTPNFSLAIQLPKNGTIHNVRDTLKTVENTLLKLIPFADIIIKSEKRIEDEIHMLELDIELQYKEPRKKFKIELTDFGTFVPEEVEEVAFDVRKSKNPFSFSLEMVLPKDADLEDSSSEICAVSNIVINNIPKQSILSDTTLRVIVSPKATHIAQMSRISEEIPNEKEIKLQHKSKLNNIQNLRKLKTKRREKTKTENKSINAFNEPNKLRDQSILKPTNESKNSKSRSNKYNRSEEIKTISPVVESSIQNRKTDKISNRRFKPSRNTHLMPPQKFSSFRWSTPKYSENILNYLYTTQKSSITRESNTEYYNPGYSKSFVDDFTNSPYNSWPQLKYEPSKEMQNIFNDYYKSSVEPKSIEEYKRKTFPYEHESSTEVIKSFLHNRNTNHMAPRRFSPYGWSTPRYSHANWPNSGNILNYLYTTQKSIFMRESKIEYNNPGYSKSYVDETTNSPYKSWSELKYRPSNKMQNELYKFSAEPESLEEYTEKTLPSDNESSTEGIKDYILNGVHKVVPVIKSFLQNRKKQPHRMPPRRYSPPTPYTNISEYIFTTEESSSSRKTFQPNIEDNNLGSTNSYQDESTNYPYKSWSELKYRPSNEMQNDLYKSSTQPESLQEYRENTLPSNNESSTEGIKDYILNGIHKIFPVIKSFLQNRKKKPNRMPPRRYSPSTPRYTPYTNSSEYLYTTQESSSSRKTFRPNIEDHNPGSTNSYVDDTSRSEKYQEASTPSETTISNSQYTNTPKNLPYNSYKFEHANDDVKDDEEFHYWNDETKKETPISVYDNDESEVLRYIENLDLSNATNLDETISNIAIAIVKIIPRENETLELTLKIKPPRNVTIQSTKNITNTVVSSLVSALSNDIINVQTKLGENDGVIDYIEMKITVSPNNTLGRLIEEKKKLQNELKKDAQLVQKFNQVLEVLEKNVNRTELIDESEDKIKLEKKSIETFLRNDLYSILSNISETLKKNSNGSYLNVNYTISTPDGKNVQYGDQLSYLLQSILENIMPSEAVRIEAQPMTKNNSSLLLQVMLKPRTSFTTSLIDLDNLNILDVESTMTKIISTDISGLQESKGNIKTIIINFLFKTTRISPLNLENIESAIEDVLQYLDLQGELISEDIKLELVKEKEIIIQLPYKISIPNSKGRKTKVPTKPDQQTEKTSKPLEYISDLILQV